MNSDELLRQLVAAEKGSSIPVNSSARSWERLTSAVGSGAEAMAVAHTIQLTTLSLLAEGAAVALVVGAIGATAIVATGPRPQARADSPAPRSTTSTSGRSQVAPVQPPSTTLGTSVSVVPVRETKPIASRVATSAMVPPAASRAQSASSLDEELQLIDRAKREIDRGRPHLARVWLDEHRSRFATGVLAAERDALKVLMTCSDANSTAAHAEAAEFLRRYPSSPLSDRIRRACHSSPSLAIPNDSAPLRAPTK